MKFGVFVVMTVTLALVWGLVFLPALFHLFGPSGNIGEIWVFLRKICCCFGRSKKSEDVQKEDITIPETDTSAAVSDP